MTTITANTTIEEAQNVFFEYFSLTPDKLKENKEKYAWSEENFGEELTNTIGESGGIIHYIDESFGHEFGVHHCYGTEYEGPDEFEFVMMYPNGIEGMEAFQKLLEETEGTVFSELTGSFGEWDEHEFDHEVKLDISNLRAEVVQDEFLFIWGTFGVRDPY